MVFRSCPANAGDIVPEQIPIFESTSTGFLPLLCALLFLVLPGCGLMDYFTDEDASQETQATKIVVSTFAIESHDGITATSSLLDLERYLIDHSPALELLRTKASKSREAGGTDAWLPGSEVRDSEEVGRRESVRRDKERRLAIDWRPSAILERDLREQSRRSQSTVATAKLREAESRLLRLLREEWSELWFERQVVSATTSSLDALDRIQEVEFDPSSPTEPILIESLRIRWNDRLEGIAQEARKTRSRINSLLGRPAQAALPMSADPGDVRFQHIDQLTERRLHPREIIAHEELALASAQLEDTEAGGWPDIVVGAQTHGDADAPVTSSASHGDSWTFTVGVEFPIGRQGKESRRRAARNRFGSARAVQMMARRSIEDEIAAARAQLLASLQRIDEIEKEVIPTIDEVRAKLPDQPTLDRFEARLRVDDGLLEAQLARVRAMADRARARFSLIDLLGLERPEPGGTYSRSTP
ncbi:MAG: TolC family protein [Planctomycetota bacterium]|nr:TolC family protein [Planctomycetota bacterium]